jgi:hypothetical protein
MARFTVNDSEVRAMFKQLEEMQFEVMTDAGRYFKKITPVDKGYARSRTDTKHLKISAKYPYAGRLDDGWSRQAPQGMSAPTEKYIDKAITEEIRRINR